MERTWAGALSDIWHSPGLPIWLAIIAATFFAIILLMTLFRADRSFASGVLAFVALFGVVIAAGTALWAALNSDTGSGQADASRAGPPWIVSGIASLPALACLDGLAGELVESACERAVFVSADSTAAAVSYTAAQIDRLSASGAAASADKVMTPGLRALRRTIERDRFGLVAHVLTVRDGCTLSKCGFFRALTNTAQISINMTEKLYEGLVGRHQPSWNAVHSPLAVSATNVAPSLLPEMPPPNVPTGKPVSGDFPSAASIPPIDIMTPEPAAPAAPAASAPSKTESTAPPPSPHPAPARRPAAQKSRVQAPVMLAPPAAADDNR